MKRKTFAAMIACALGLATSGCEARHETDRLSQGAHGPSSPAESGQHGPDAMDVDKEKSEREHQTAGLTSEISNGKTDATMEGSGNLAWQGSYEREKRAKTQGQAASGGGSPAGLPQ